MRYSTQDEIIEEWMTKVVQKLRRLLDITEKNLTAGGHDGNK